MENGTKVIHKPFAWKMHNKKLTKNKTAEKFSNGLFLIILSITISMLAFINEENKITGFVTANRELDNTALQNHLIEFKDIDSLKTLGVGNYYIDSDGILYWLDDESRPAIAKVDFVDEITKNRHIYIDKDGRIGYILSEKNQLQSS